MTDTSTRVACCQYGPRVGEPEANRARGVRAIRDAAEAGARVIVLPELASSGYVFRDRDEAARLAEPVDGPTVTEWGALAADLGVVVVAGLCERGEDGALFNSAVVLDESGLRAAYRKVHLWDTEKLVFETGDAPPPVVTAAGVRLGVLICYDLEFPEWVRIPALAGAQLLCVPTNWPRFPRPAGQRPIEVVRAQAAASVNRMFVAACDRVGAERGVDWVGGSVIVDADGWPLAGPAPGDDEFLLSADCRLGEAVDKAISDRNDVFADRRTDLYAAIEKGRT
ncbi:MAG TPA: nitrilase family protein [Pseudonocardiaceae bacterium]|nr:nitrilase family protein [Pseudonocardiaceae bacterium]